MDYVVSSTDLISIFGGIDYNADSSTLLANSQPFKKTLEGNLRSLPNDATRGNKWEELPGSRDEVEGIKKFTADRYNVKSFSGAVATEEAFKALEGKNSPVIIHVATHGFFFPDPVESGKQDPILSRFQKSGKAFREASDPLLRSGLLFAGANHAWQSKPIKGIEDGILTAYEVANMSLPNTKLVVLSACETALGDIQGAEGVYGLQRAFKMAEVENLVMSLWKVPDTETSEFMQDFYRNLFDKLPIAESFYKTQSSMRDKYRDEPHKWAAWVLIR